MAKLFLLLEDDIMERYNNPEYWNEDSPKSAVGHRIDIGNRYNNIEYWDLDIVRSFLREEESIDKASKSMCRDILGIDEFAELTKGRSL